MKIVAISDLHGNLPEIPDCDLLLIAGDITPADDHGLQRQFSWLHSEFRKWLLNVPARKIVGVAGNHDFIFQTNLNVVSDLPWVYLQDSGIEWDGVKIWGSPWQPVFHNWAFNAEDAKRKTAWSMIPDDTNILITHGPPHGYGDFVDNGYDNRGNVGCRWLNKRIVELNFLKLAVFGHIHSGWGKYTINNERTTLANVSIVDDRYRLVNPPMMFEYIK